MKYISTRGKSEPRTFIQAVLEGLARDGGLLVPEKIPDFSDRLNSLSHLSYQELALEIFLPFIDGEISTDKLTKLIRKSYSTFRKAEVTPVLFTDRVAILELFHGPTLAFKDIALQFLGNLFEEILAETGSHLTILGATSGDTGSAAIYGVRGKDNMNIFMLHPKGKVSPVQEKQMTTVLDSNVHNIALEGTFDDAQRIVKEVFNDLEFRDQYNLGAVNSINWARVMAQIVYYFYAAFRYEEKYPGKDLYFAVPTGNFGDIYAGYLAKKMGLPIKKLILATNENDILYRVISTGQYKISQVHATISPSMDIQVASNFERFVFDVSNQNGESVEERMSSLASKGEFELSKEEKLKAESCFIPIRINAQQTLKCIKDYDKAGIELDPHTAVGIAAAEQSGYENVITLATAHPAKFGEAVHQALGKSPSIPEALEGIMEKETRCAVANNDFKEVEAMIENLLLG
jgi:threonine synthase